ncbi:MAG: hypothetical protein M3174_03470 [Actinomycetota bacterium]|nr:hypothetical protein [Actinomycetota bacterium]
MHKVLAVGRAHVSTLVGIALIMVLLAGHFGQGAVNAHHEPANKFAAAGSAVEDVEPNTDHVILSETMKVSSPFDLALSATAECSILTYLRTTGSSTPGASELSRTEGRVEMWITIDGKRVPVQTGDIDPQTPGVQQDDGEVTFCNREYERRVIDTEDDGDGNGDGIDEERDFIRTKNANAFNWFALDVGANYDDPTVPAGAGNNIVLVELWARYYKEGADPCQETTAGTQEDCSDAYVGKRTLVAEPTNASVHEAVLPGPGTGN